MQPRSPSVRFSAALYVGGIILCLSYFPSMRLLHHTALASLFATFGLGHLQE